MSGGFAGGLFEGIQAGTRIGLARRQEEFEEGLRKRQQNMAEQEQTVRNTDANRRQASDALNAIQQQKADLSRQLYLSTQAGDASSAKAYYQQVNALHDAEQQALRSLGGADLHDFVKDAKQTGDDLHYGNKTLADLSPRETTSWLTATTGRAASDFIDTSNRLSPVGQSLQKFHTGVANVQQDGGKQLLEATNELAGHELQGLIGRPGTDGSTVIGAEFAPPVPHPGSPQHLTAAVHLTYRSPDGKLGEQYVPLMDDHGQMLMHPDDSAGGTVKNFQLKQIFDHVGALETMYKAVNADPETKDKLIQGYLEGHEDTASRMLDWMHVLGHDEAEYKPRMKVFVDAEGNIKTQLPGSDEVHVLPRRGVAGAEEELRQQLIDAGVPQEEATMRAVLAYHPKQYRGGLVGPDSQREPLRAPAPKIEPAPKTIQVLDPADPAHKQRIAATQSTGVARNVVATPVKAQGAAEKPKAGSLQALPKTQAELKPNTVYNTARGPATWDGKVFHPVK